MMDAGQHRLHPRWPAQDQLPPRQPVQAPRPSIIEICCSLWCLFWSILVPAMLFLGAVYFMVDQAFFQEPHYSVAIHSVSGLDPGFGGRPKLDLELNLTFRVESHGLWVPECAELGMHVEVSYRGVLLASSMTTTEKICAGPRKAVDRSIVARGAGLVVPGSVLDSLTGDMHNGVQVFDIALRGWGEHANYMCGPRRVDDCSALQKDCAEIAAAVVDMHSTTGH